MLNGKRILITRPVHQAEQLEALIKKFEGNPITIPLLKIIKAPDEQKVQEALKHLYTYDWIIFTSANGVQFFFEALTEEMKKILQAKKIAVVGKKTNITLKKYGFHADLMPSYFVAESLAEILNEKLSKPQSILIVRGNLSRTIIKDELREIGHFVHDVIFYETIGHEENKRRLVKVIQDQHVDFVTFTSSSAVTEYVNAFENDLSTESSWANVKTACIGPITAKALQDKGLKPTIIAKEFTIDGLVEEMINYYKEDN